LKGEAVVLSIADVWPQLAGPEAVASSLGGGAADWSPVDFHRARKMAREQLAEARTIGERGAEKLGGLLPEWQISAEAEADAPHWAIVRRSDVWKPDLILLGSHGRSALGRFFLGSVSTAVLTHARGSVRIARRSERPEGRPLRLILGIDGSPGSAAAAHVLAARKWPGGTQVKVVSVLDTAVSTALPVAAAMAWQEIRFERAQDWVSEITGRVAAQLCEAGLEASPLVLEGNPKKVLLEEAGHWQADCIVVGAKGLSRLERFLLGSVSTAVASRAACSVEVVRETTSTE
jgi:nucleotide-binding universal stress UspA family protein